MVLCAHGGEGGAEEGVAGWCCWLVLLVGGDKGGMGCVFCNTL